MKELAHERAAAKEAITALRLAPVLFETGARPHPPRDLYRAYLEQSDIFIGIYASDYGWVAPDMEISGIEDEWRSSGGVPRLVYVKDVPVREPRLREMLDCISEVGDVSYKRFQGPDDLRELVADDLALLLTERFLPSSRAREGDAPDVDSRLPSYPNALIGREEEVRTLSELLLRDGMRLVTLVGPGGTGKTRLAVDVAQRICDRYPDGTIFVPLADIRDPSFIPAAIATALGVREAADATSDVLVAKLRGKTMLLVLDNFEHVLDAAATVSNINERAPSVTVLATSRSPLEVYGEYEFSVAPLAVPARDAAVRAVASSPAVRLFVERAQSVRRDFTLNDENAHDVSDICAKLDGLPLAIELVAARVRLLPPRAIRERLRERLDVHNAARRGKPARQQTMRAAIGWSYDLLDEREQQLFAWLSVFAGGFDISAVEAVCGQAQGVDVLDVLASLTGKSLVRASTTEDGEPRFEMLQLIRDYALERLAERAEAPDARDAHVAYFSAFARNHEQTMMQSQTEADRRPLDREYANVRDALLWSLERLADHAEATRWSEEILATLYFYWYMSKNGSFSNGRSEGRDLSERALEVAESTGNRRVRAMALFALGTQAMWSELPDARSWLRESVSLWRELGDVHRLALAVMLSGITALRHGRTNDAKDHLLEAADLLRRDGNMPALGIVMMHLGDVFSADGDRSQARSYLLDALNIQRESGGGWTIAAVLNSLGELERVSGHYVKAGEHYAEALSRFEAVHAPGDVARCHHALGYVALRTGDIAAARESFEKALAQFETAANLRGIAECTLGLAGVDVTSGEYERAARLMGAADRVLEDLGVQPWPSDAREREHDRAAISRAIGEAALEREHAAGRRLGVHQPRERTQHRPS